LKLAKNGEGSSNLHATFLNYDHCHDNNSQFSKMGLDILVFNEKSRQACAFAFAAYVCVDSGAEKEIIR
jgi:hypothetical protein